MRNGELAPPRLLVLILFGLVLQTASWTVRTFAYIRCCATETDPTRASNYPLLLVPASLTLSLGLNTVILWQMWKLFVAKRSEEGKLLFRDKAGAFVAKAFINGSLWWSLPLAIVSYVRGTNLNAAAYLSFLLAPTVAGIIDIFVRSRRAVHETTP